jgi:hypothetical protein
MGDGEPDFEGTTLESASVFTPEVMRQDGQNRIARTGVQSGVAGALIVVGLWVAHQAGWRGDMPPEVVAASGFLLTTLGAWFTNRSRLRGEA